MRCMGDGRGDGVNDRTGDGDQPEIRRHERPDGLPPVNGYSHVVEFGGRMVAVSGQVPLDGDGRLIGVDDPPAQFRQAFENLVAALAVAGTTLDRVVKLTVFLTDLADLPAFRQVRDEFLVPGRLPACSLVQVSDLVHPAFRIEMEALAAV